MNKIINLTKTLTKNLFRQPDIVFFTLIFPSLLLMFFIYVFGGLYEAESNIQVTVGVVYQEELNGFTEQIFDNVFSEFKKNMSSSKIEILDSGENIEQIIKDGDYDIIIEFPANINNLNLKMMTGLSEVDKIKFYHSPNSQSILSRDIMSSVFEQINLMINAQGKDIDLVTQYKNISTENDDFDYNQFIFPGIIVMSIFTVSIFNLPIAYVSDIETKIIKRIKSTPVKGYQYFLSLLISNLFILLLSFIIIYVVGYYNGIENIFNINFMMLIIYYLICGISFGLLIASFFKKIASVSVFTNIIYFLTIFLSGLYFPVKDVPWAIRWFVYFNPGTYMVDGLRNFLDNNMIDLNQIVIPLIWAILGVTIFSVSYRRLIKDE
ncbi:ABC transporter permease [Geotoga petraea]|uniref:ABC transporter permease n=1 Tax=Geotoga petraea TaxID=28234 RepID=A0A4Z0W3B7_9BACT|nr:ABC transporter permease [Geotoga petraea]TGG89039.1 ABC transporter permease [Geotoga petraea]